MATWAAIFAMTRISSLGALTASIAASVAAWYFLGAGAYTAVILVMTAFLIWRHRANIRNLLAGTEGKVV
jgi:glycerol-3-phosphate acyltransferase PlsY